MYMHVYVYDYDQYKHDHDIRKIIKHWLTFVANYMYFAQFIVFALKIDVLFVHNSFQECVRLRPNAAQIYYRQYISIFSYKLCILDETKLQVFCVPFWFKEMDIRLMIFHSVYSKSIKFIEYFYTLITWEPCLHKIVKASKTIALIYKGLKRFNILNF